MSPNPALQSGRTISHHAGPHRRGFSLVELMIVIVIIAILAAFILPALGSASRTAQITKVQVDIKGLETNLVSFQTEFGEIAPSGITLFEEAGMWSVASQTQIRRLWPQFDFTMPRDINGDGDMTDTIVLSGSECLVFFLGGVTATKDSTGTSIVAANGMTSSTGVPASWVPLGFSKNPRDPFERSGGTRSGPFQEFEPSRLVNNISAPANTEEHGMPELLDTLPSQSNPYLYISSNGGRGYQVPDGTPPDPPDLVGPSPSNQLRNVYLQEDGDPMTLGDPTEIPWNKTSFQIISPGYDTLYGLGGVYNPEDPQLIGNRADDADNITNFATGELGS